MKVLVLNSGSSSLKYQLFDMTDESVLANGLVDKIGIAGSKLIHSPSGKSKYELSQDIKDHEIAIQLVLDALIDGEHGVLAGMDEIDAVGHRVVQGGAIFPKSCLVDEDVKAKIKHLAELAPLHNIPALQGIEACQHLMPGVKQVTVFDTSFHQTMKPDAYIYGIPYEMYEKHEIRRYGAHGTSHKYVANKAAEMLGKDIEDTKIITCHLGNGSSITAVEGGKCVDTSMGLTPLEGLIMGTRCGVMDPAIVPFIMEKEGYTPAEMKNFMNKKCGFLGISGVSSDLRDVEEAAANGNERAQLAIDVFYHMIVKYIGSYAALMGGVDAIVFTAGIGENGIGVRENVLERLTLLGVKLDKEANNCRGKAVQITAADSKVKGFVIPTNEEVMIARDTAELV